MHLNHSVFHAFLVNGPNLLGFYKGFTAYLGEGEDIVAVYDRKSRTPFTGLVPAYLAEARAGRGSSLVAEAGSPFRQGGVVHLELSSSL